MAVYLKPFGLVSEDPDVNYVGLAPSTQWDDTFTEEDYRTLVGKMLDGTIIVSDSIDNMPETTIVVNDLGSIKNTERQDTEQREVITCA